MSLLGIQIKARQMMALEAAPLVVSYWMSLAKNCGEFGDNLETFAAHFHQGDNPVAWEALCDLMDAFPEAKLAYEVGIKVAMMSPDHAEVKYSGA